MEFWTFSLDLRHAHIYTLHTYLMVSGERFTYHPALYTLALNITNININKNNMKLILSVDMPANESYYLIVTHTL